MNNIRRIVLWSGGADSTKCLIELLEQTNDPVIALHLHGDLPPTPMDSGVIYGEKQAIATLTPILQKRFRPFQVKSFYHKRFIFDEEDHVGDEISTFPLIYTLDGMQTKIYVPRNADDIFTQNEREQQWPASLARAVYLGKLLRNELIKTTSIMIDDYNVHKSKLQIYRELGDLRNLTWSCIGPVDKQGFHCGKCAWCVERTKFFKTLTNEKEDNT